MTFRRYTKDKNNNLLKPQVVVAETRGANVISNQSFVLKSTSVPSSGHICIIRSVGGIGDVLMITPGIRALKEKYPDLKITVAVDMHSTWDCSYKEMLKNAPFIDNLIDARYVDRNKYSKVVDISSVCIAYENTQFKPKNRIDIFANALGIKELNNPLPFYKVESDEREWAINYLKDRNTFGKILIGLCPSSNEHKRSWAREEVLKFVELVKEKSAVAKILLFDFQNEYSDLKSLDFVIDCSNTTVRKMASLIERCHSFVTPDTGPMHLAGALQIPTIALFGSIPPQARINHYPSHEAVTAVNLGCLGCWYKQCNINFKCMSDIPAKKVFDKAWTKANNFRKEIIFSSVLSPVDGYGSSAEQIAVHLGRLTSVSWNAEEQASDWRDFIGNESEKLISKDKGKHLIYYSLPSWKEEFNSSLTKSCFTMWETTKPPSTWIPTINLFDRLIVPCEQNKIAFQNQGTAVPIEICSLGVNEKIWIYKKRKTNKAVRFLLFANSHWEYERKNYRAALEAFSLASKENPNIELVLKLTDGDIPVEYRYLKNIEIISWKYNTAMLVDLVHSCDCLLSPTKGEGYGLPQREAMSTGMPVIAANFAGLQSIMNLDFNYSVKYELKEASYYSTIPVLKAYNNESNDFGSWAEPDILSLKDRILEAAEDRVLLQERGIACADWIRANETYTHTARRLLEIIRS
jgi:ADP-heptose:LPS heptosyltransferase/glycosyltransferase involved in cell wall biosynthesis